MVRQCAWCLWLINSRGERTSALPLPKIYEATHGICKVCGILWLEAVGGSNGNAGAMVISQSEDGRLHIECIGCVEERMWPAMSPVQENDEKDLLSLAGGRC